MVYAQSASSTAPRLWPRMARVLPILVVVALLVAGSLATRPVAAHEDGTPSPNGASPWHFSESWVMTNYYGEGLHHDMYNGAHYNEYYALDFALSGDGCWKRLYPLWDGMTVTRVDDHIIEMQKEINGAKYRLRYMHLNSILVGVGQTVHTTTLIGYTGDKGQATGCHLHMSVHRFTPSTGWWHSIPPQFCGRTYPHDHQTRWKGC